MNAPGVAGFPVSLRLVRKLFAVAATDLGSQGDEVQRLAISEDSGQGRGVTAGGWQ
ncbi:MAG: hypothetical protein ABI047_01255 [Jatrophihabitantaceae bacterium]